MNYKGYEGTVTYDDEAKIFHGEVIGISDMITFQGTSVGELEQAFKDSIDDYLEFCKKKKRSPEKPFSGRLLLRIPAKIHKEATIAAKRQGMSLNSYIKEIIEEASKNPKKPPNHNRLLA